MKEVSAVFQDGFKRGLSPDTTLFTQEEYLTQCYNMVPGAFGIEERKEVFAPDIFYYPQWPFPAFYSLSRYNLIFTRENIFALDQDWRPHAILAHNFKSLPHVADFMDFVVFSTMEGQWTWNGAQVTKDLAGATFKTCCNFKGQLIIGNCTLPDGPHKESCNGPLTYNIPVGGEAVVAWSKIGSLEWEYTLGNEVGWAPMPWQGQVLAVLPLLNEVVVYGSNGIAKLSAHETPVTTFGVQDFGDIGLLNRECVAGDTIHHVFLGTDYNLYLIEPERALSGEGKAPKRLGYAHILKDLKNPIITFDPAFSQWWIGDENKCFIFTGEALGEANITPTHLNRLDGILWSYFQEHGPSSAVVETSPISFNSRGIKTLMNVEAEIASDIKVKGWASSISNYQKDWYKGKAIPLDPRGAFFPILAGTLFKVAIEASDFHNFRLTKMWLHFKNTDKTFSRGVINAGRPDE